MKKNFYIILIILLSSLIFPLCKANVNVYPLEIMIKMNEELYSGNTSKKIYVSNNNDFIYNSTWYIEHPNPISWLRPNKTIIPDLSWINVTPKWIKISPNEIGEFYIYFDIPKTKENLNQHWETWITFKKGEGNEDVSQINQEFAVRVYIDTPEYMNNKLDKRNSFHQDVNNTYIIFFMITLIILIIILIYFNKKKKNN